MKRLILILTAMLFTANAVAGTRSDDCADINGWNVQQVIQKAEQKGIIKSDNVDISKSASILLNEFPLKHNGRIITLNDGVEGEKLSTEVIKVSLFDKSRNSTVNIIAVTLVSNIECSLTDPSVIVIP
ncbi:hypothetical protein GPY51_02560 [Photorhabdus laumondii subsp. laumondii]|uniref:Photorhabdus luminescens subsp. laumondii TTO1 complete genome segment 6/17 n=3 Tax=Photorhabdus TaxID=29487 RepID=Q7N6S9_PHOLL|nr:MULTISPECIES: hypothetical protein [Photorhabdus]AWK41329.1 hypothetical protein A4R40_07430 [Photorhabdus laumondii subsp. laumondii]AXG42062.1 hypothetical protein PluDJC_07215 [Photorhabdus laumondii subsp. laumondii]AXG46650.1 hypothetical protein PluTT01m_07600 [Photorhabdus laumondii subsp. laumondii]KTL62045.1 hypothetical protein AA106_21410 [Photorhabdus laumondii subsp. laumondii]MCC8373630.1 hypothetical protein [Photorhabdus bodei]